MDTYGWVADLVNSGNAVPGDMLCPSNPAKALEKLNDLLGVSTSGNLAAVAPAAGNTTARMRAGAGAGLIDASNAALTSWANPSNTNITFASRAEYVGGMYVDQGYMTNYAAGYFLARLAPIMEKDTSNNTVSATGGGFKERQGTTGPLSSATLDRSRVATSNIPLLGDAGPGDVDEAILGEDVPNTKVELPRGMLLAEAFNDGPAYYQSDVDRIILLDAGVDMSVEINCERGEATTANCNSPLSTATVGSGDPGITYLQDTRDWFAIHSGGCNILMGDGSVKLFNDDNGDGYLNPGFPVDNTVAGFDASGIGYSDDEVGVAAGRVLKNGCSSTKRVSAIQKSNPRDASGFAC